MKPILPVLAIIAIALVVVLGLAAFSPKLESPRDRLFAQIDAEIARAQRMLVDYDPTGERLNQTVGTTQPAEVDPDRWQAFLQELTDNSPAGPALQRDRSALQKLGQRYAELEGQAPPQPGQPGGPEAYSKIQNELQRNGKLIAEALNIVRAAVALSEGEVSGADHPAATRLEAVLSYHQADLLRRRAALHRTAADDARIAFHRNLQYWSEHDTAARALAADLGDRQAGDDAPTIAQRREQLQTDRTEVSAAIADAEQQAEQLRGQIATLQTRLAEAEKIAQTAEQRMIELDTAGIDSTDPDAAEAFVKAYDEASATHRGAYMEAETLKHGSLRHATVPGDVDDVLTAPLQPKSGNGPIEPERGLDALQSDLRVAEGLVKNQQAVLAEINRQLAALDQREADAGKRRGELQAAAAESLAIAQASARTAVGETLAADRLETEAIDLATGRGQQAASRAKRAMDGRISQARNDQQPEAPNPRLILLAGDNVSPGHAALLAGDMSYVTALTLAQRAEDFARHARFLEALAPTGLTTDQLLPEGETTEDTPPAVLQADAAGKAVAEARTQAAEAARAAIETYQLAAGEQLRNLWVVHTQIAAMHYLLANLSTGPESDRHRAEARAEYQRALRDRQDRPEMRVYSEVMAGLTPATDQ